MQIKFENFGQAGSGALTLSDLTLICGQNNSGKTYTSYAVYAVLKNFKEFFRYGVEDEVERAISKGEPATVNLKEIRKNFDKYLTEAGQRFGEGLDDFFNAPDDFFSDSEFSFDVSQELGEVGDYRATVRFSKEVELVAEVDPDAEILTIAYLHDEGSKLPRVFVRNIIRDLIWGALLEDKFPSPFVVTSERTGVSLFYKDLDYNTNAIISHLRDSDKIDPIKLIEARRSRYAQPIQDNIDAVRDYDNISKQKSYLRKDREKYKYVFDAMNELLGGGGFKSSNGQLAYRTKRKRKEPSVVVPLYIASSSIKSLFLVDMYINHVARENQVLIIDEPELNLHPDNQVRVARLIARLVNAGVKVLLTTHSDYIVREINNLVALSGVGEEQDDLLGRYNLSKHDVLEPSRVRAYCADPSEGFCEMEVSKVGIDTIIFDNVIADENIKSQDIHFSVE
ncbi:AAA family ATPase [Labrenzia sp. R4_1]|uniref:AAA family ATPase n=1 Tax=Labrenzia sp. R4_1 TaxID=2821106 RepID=UPI001ADD261E|nr:AAA family ATPase [Labrenzia sp. R4_1]MBO9424781.1 AAA family ATPase [Labrenzia sp. R4_1]